MNTYASIFSKSPEENCGIWSLRTAHQFTTNRSKIVIIIHYIFIQRLGQCFIADF
jgi:hypothetical protein